MDPDVKMVSTTTDLITETVDFDLEGKTLQEYLKYQLIGMVKDMIKAAGTDIPTLADYGDGNEHKEKTHL